MFSKQLTCSHCGWRTVCGKDDVAARLRLVGLLRRENDPSDALLEELLPGAAERMTCPGCKQIGLVAGDTEEVEDDWLAAVLCQQCRKPIDPERLDALPDAKFCLNCQQKSESGSATEDEPDFCPKCGALMELRVSRGGGLTRYRLFCTGSPPCRTA